MSKFDPPPIQRSDLKPGDVLLMYGDAPISDLIRQLAGGNYSHAGYWSDAGDVIDAGPAGVMHVPLDERLYHERYVDAWRFKSADGHQLGDPGWPQSEVEASFHKFLNSETGGTKFAYHRLFMVAMLFIVKAGTKKIPFKKKVIRLLFEWALEVIDQWLSKGTVAVTCSGLVYSAFDEAEHNGFPHRYQIGVDNPYVIPAPDADTGPLDGRAALGATLGQSLDRLGKASGPAQEFLEKYAMTTGMNAGGNLGALAAHVYANFVNPADLERSPNLELIGRVQRDYAK